MIESFTRSFAALKDGYFWKYLAFTAGLTLILYSIVFYTTQYGIAQLDIADWWLIGSFIQWLGSAAVVIISYFLAPIIFPAIAYLFVDAIATGVEKKYYPQSVGMDSTPLIRAIPASIKFITVTILLNLFVAPLYLIPLVNAVIYYMLNSYLLGREFFEIVCLRHSNLKETKKLRRNKRFYVISTGAIILAISLIPVVNLIAPIIGTIFMVHIFYRLRDT